MRRVDERWQLYDLDPDEQAAAGLALFHPVSLLSALCGVVLVAAGLWTWGQAGSWSWTQGAARPEVMASGIRCAAVAIVAAGEALWVVGVVNRVYVADGFSRLLQWVTMGAMLIAGVCALSLGWAGH